MGKALDLKCKITRGIGAGAGDDLLLGLDVILDHRIDPRRRISFQMNIRRKAEAITNKAPEKSEAAVSPRKSAPKDDQR